MMRLMQDKAIFSLQKCLSFMFSHASVMALWAMSVYRSINQFSPDGNIPIGCIAMNFCTDNPTDW